MTDRIETIGCYTVLRALDVGESDAVYLATDPILMREVAIKVVRRGVGKTAPALARFRKAEEAAATLKHPVIVDVLDVGVDPVAGVFIVMEFVDGRSLSSLANSGNVDIETRLRWLLQVMRALEVAHESGVVHGDVKLSKVLVDWWGAAKLVDFAGRDGASGSLELGR